MAMIDYIHPDDVIEASDGCTYVKLPDYLIRIVREGNRGTHAHLYWFLRRTYPLLVLSIIVGDTTISVERIEEMQGPWTFEDELEALDERGW